MRLTLSSLLPVWFIFFFCACGQNQTPQKKEVPADAQLPSFTVVPPDSGNFYKRFSGTLGTEEGVLQLLRYGGKVEGYYYSESSGICLQLANYDVETQPDSSISLQEMGQAPVLLGHGEDASWHFRMAGNTISGVWRGMDGRDVRNIQMHEAYPEGSVSLYAYWKKDSAALWPGRPNSPHAWSSYGYLLPADNHYVFLNNELKEQLIPGQPHSTQALSELVDAAMKQYFDEYKKENESLHLPGKDKLEAVSFSYTDDNMVRVLYNDDGWLVTEFFSSSYTGGAHNMYASSFANIDRTQKRLWKLSDMISDTAALHPMLDDAAIRYFGISTGQSLDQRLLVADIPVTDNIYIGPKGLCFVYGPYEIAPYSEGQISLYLSYDKLYNLLRPEFRERMKLGARSGTAALFPHPSFKKYSHA